jgi:hypothetical protein
MGKLHPATQHRENRLGNHAALAVPELRMCAKETARGSVGWAVQSKDFSQQSLSLSNQKTM